MEKKEWPRLESNILPPFSSADAKIKGASASEKSGAPANFAYTQLSLDLVLDHLMDQFNENATSSDWAKKVS
jgi:hypothetical protein